MDSDTFGVAERDGALMSTLRSKPSDRELFQAVLDLHSADPDSPPPPMLALMLALVQDRLKPARLDDHGCEINSTVLLRDVLPSEATDEISAWLKAHFAPDCICDECGQRIGERYPLADLPDLEPKFLFALTPTGFKSYFLCEDCAEQWESRDAEGIPKVIARLKSHLCGL